MQKKNNSLHFVLSFMLSVSFLFFSSSSFAWFFDSAAETTVSPSAKAADKKNLVTFVEHLVSSLRYSIYRMGGKRFDPERGVYVVDCSNFIDNILRETYPEAYDSLVDATGSDTPASGHYYKFFNRLHDQSDNLWSKINDPAKLRAGDVLVFRYKNARGHETGGHVMIVMDKPVQDANIYFVRVADSALGAHSDDTRQPNTSGIGIGTLLLKASTKTGRPFAYAWGEDSYWNQNVKVAMARPKELSGLTV